MASRALFLAILTPLLASPLALGCGGEGSDTTADTTTTGTTSTSTTEASTEPPGTSTEAPTTSSPTTSTSASTTTTEAMTTGTSTGTTTEATTGAGLDCAAIPMAPELAAPEYLGGGFNGSEDLGFDGAGGLALKGGEQVEIVDADFNTSLLATGLPQVYGTRFAINGDLLIALPQSGKLQAITPEGMVSDVATDLESPNGLYVDPSGAVWLTEFGGSQVVRFDAEFKNKVPVYQGPDAASANGVVYDPDRGLLFFTNYGAGRLLKLEVNDEGEANGPAVEIATIPGAALDGLVLDACGNLYVVDQGNSRLYRAWLDAQVEIVGEPELLAEFDDNVANAQFGWGEGWEPESLYVIGNPGSLYRLAVGVPGAPIGLP